MKKTTVGLVADVAYLYAAKEKLGGNIDYATLRRRVEDYTQATVTTAVAHLKGIPNQGKFLGSLRHASYRYTFCNDPQDSPAWVAMMAETILAVAPHVHVLAVASCDPRLTSILDFAADVWGVKIVLVGFDGTLGDIGDTSDAKLYVDERCIYVRQPAEVQQ